MSENPAASSSANPRRPVTLLRRLLVPALLLACSSSTSAPSPAPTGGGVLIVRLFDLGANENGGGGDAVLVTDSSDAGRRHLLLDAGPAGPGGADSTLVARRLTALGVDTLEAVVLSHAHSDHFYGLPAAVRKVHVRRFFHNGQTRHFPRYDATIAFAESEADTTFVPRAATSRELGGAGSAVFTVLPPLPAHLEMADADGSEINEGSLGTSVSMGDVSLFFAGDGEREANARWRTLAATATLGVEVLKVGHHGANDAVFDFGSSGASSWLDHVAPALALVSANGRSHPRTGAVAELLGRGIETWCTSVHGDVVLRIDRDGRISVTPQRNPDEPCRAGSDAET